jgi:type I restriction enzyme S subunit
MITVYKSDLPDGWEADELRRVTLRKRGYSWSKEDESDRADDTTVPVLRIPNIQGKLDLSNLLHLRNVSKTSLRESGVTKNWILFVGSNGNPDRIGDSALMEVDRPMVFASFLMALASKYPERITPEFLALWLKLHTVHEAFSKTSQQTTGLANFSWSAVKRLPVRYPTDRREQEAISKALTLAEDCLSAAGAKLIAARRLKTALMQQLFTRGIPGRQHEFVRTKWFEAPSSWKLRQLRQIAKVESGFTMGRDLSGHDTIEVAYLTVVNVLDGTLDLSKVARVEVKQSELDGLVLRAGDILMTEGGDRDKVGRGGLWLGQIEPCVYQNHIFRVRLTPGTYKPQLFHFLLQTWHSKNYFYSHAKQTSNLCTINSRELKRFPLFEPSEDEQDKMIELLSTAEAQVLAVEGEIAALTRLKRSLLQNLLTGKVRVKPLETSP